jgi:hypothetical protein
VVWYVVFLSFFQQLLVALLLPVATACQQPSQQQHLKWLPWSVDNAQLEECAASTCPACMPGWSYLLPLPPSVPQVLRKYYLDPLRRNQMWSQRHDSRGALPSGTTRDQLPLHMPCLDFVLTWHTNLKKQPVVSFWKPLPPAGGRCRKALSK